MLTADEIERLQGAAAQLLDPVTEYLLRDIARRISEAGQLTATASYEVWRAQQLGLSQKEIKKRLRSMLKVSEGELEKLLTQAAETGYRFDLSRLPHENAVAFRDNQTVQQIVSAAVELARDDLTNITQSLGMIDPYGKALPLQEAYRSCCDYAFLQVSTGAADYNTAIRQATKNLAEKGVQTVDYESGAHASVEAAVRRSVFGALGLMQEQIGQNIHDATGCDGWEISAHTASAPDHEPIQGKQYSDAEYTALNNSLVRRIGTLHCGHAAHPIILGVSKPQYTPEELEQLRQENEKGVDYEGRHYTMYEATQLQRRLERAMRKQKRKILVDEAAGDEEKLVRDRLRLNATREEYRRFSKAAGLRTQDERHQVAGFGNQQAADEIRAVKKVENERLLAYNKVQEESRQKQAEIREQILSDKIPKKLNIGNQNKHIKESHGYIQGRSYIYGNLETAQALVEKYHGTGTALFTRAGEWNNKEVVLADELIGVNIEPGTGVETETRRFTIHYGKKGTHIVPAKEIEK